MTSDLRRFADLLLAIDPGTTADFQAETATLRLPSGGTASFWLPATELAAALASLGPAGNELWPEAPTDLAALRLLSIHLAEHAESRQPLGARGYQLKSGRFEPWN